MRQDAVAVEAFKAHVLESTRGMGGADTDVLAVKGLK